MRSWRGRSSARGPRGGLLLPERELSFPAERHGAAGAQVLDGVDDASELVLEIATHEEAAYQRTRYEAAGCLLTEYCPPHTDPVYHGVLEPLFKLAGGSPVRQ